MARDFMPELNLVGSIEIRRMKIKYCVENAIIATKSMLLFKLLKIDRN